LRQWTWGQHLYIKERSELTATGLEVRKIVVHDEDEAAMCVTGFGLSDGMVVEIDVVMFQEMLLGDDVGGSAFGHAGRMGGPGVKLTRVAVLVGEVELNEPIPMNVNVDAFDVGGGR
jgi:hypothetical protein